MFGAAGKRGIRLGGAGGGSAGLLGPWAGRCRPAGTGSERRGPGTDVEGGGARPCGCEIA